jgi:hypothetical protein
MTAEEMADVIASEARRLADEMTAARPRVQTPALTIGIDAEAMGAAVGRAVATAVGEVAAAGAAAIAEERAARAAHMGALAETMREAVAAIPGPADMAGVERALDLLAAAAREMAAPIDLAPVADAVRASGEAVASAITKSALALVAAQNAGTKLVAEALDKNTAAQLRDRDLKFDSSGKIVGTKVA